ncbi:HAD domain-containing protein [Rhodoferax mekongensis]|uniref:HAD domain-containing protein n=1 Tax=Rhodoferax mekongensis TaxID=3068341 RepID=A0ABZ0AWG7_9BURK|nr:HAD domain-containing protein [Rhodoferax sp. TBRC 17307]WNO03973.1 HAD domain-containing protein [Rhodoferax sp. TBRC 17307]
MRGKNEHILYLDFDGVLHHSEVWYHPRVGPYFPSKVPNQYKLFQHLGLLEQLLEPYPKVSIVLSTTWSRRYGPYRAGKNLGHKLSPRVIGATFHSRMNPEEFDNKLRGVQVYEDVLRRKPAQWLALDDDTEGWPGEVRDRYIRTHLTDGISDSSVLSAIKERFKKYFGGG